MGLTRTPVVAVRPCGKCGGRLIELIDAPPLHCEECDEDMTNRIFRCEDCSSAFLSSNPNTAGIHWH